jgi:hypothetical protein
LRFALYGSGVEANSLEATDLDGITQSCTILDGQLFTADNIHFPCMETGPDLELLS